MLSYHPHKLVHSFSPVLGSEFSIGTPRRAFCFKMTHLLNKTHRFSKENAYGAKAWAEAGCLLRLLFAVCYVMFVPSCPLLSLSFVAVVVCCCSSCFILGQVYSGVIYVQYP